MKKLMATRGTVKTTGRVMSHPRQTELPFISQEAFGHWRERYSEVCKQCFEQKVHCSADSCGVAYEQPLRLLIIGLNPSEVAWSTGRSYANQSNWFWRLMRTEVLRDEKIQSSESIHSLPAPPHLCGFTDVLCERGSDASAFSYQYIQHNSTLFQRLEAHVQRVHSNFHWLQRQECEPAIVAFAGKRQFKDLFAPALKKCDVGFQAQLPSGWPLQHSQVFVLPSSSGRAAMTKEERAAPYRDLGEQLVQIPSPRVSPPTSSSNWGLAV